MRTAKTLAIALSLISPLLAWAGEPDRSLPERDVGLAVARATDLRLVPDTRSFLWFRLYLGHYKPTRAEFVASLVFDGPNSAPDSLEIKAILVEAIEPIATQVATYISANPSAPIEAASRALRVERTDYHESTCPAVREIVDRFSLAVPDVFRRPWEPLDFYHGEHLQIEGYTNNSFFSLVVQEDNPLFKWGLKAASALRRCRND